MCQGAVNAPRLQNLCIPRMVGKGVHYLRFFLLQNKHQNLSCGSSSENPDFEDIGGIQDVVWSCKIMRTAICVRNAFANQTHNLWIGAPPLGGGQWSRYQSTIASMVFMRCNLIQFEQCSKPLLVDDYD